MKMVIVTRKDKPRVTGQAFSPEYKSAVNHQYLAGNIISHR